MGISETCCAFSIQFLVMSPIVAVLVLNELIAPEIHQHCAYSPSLFIRVLLLLDLLVLTFVGWSLMPQELFKAFRYFCIEFTEVVDLMRDLLIYTHILTPAVTLVMLLTYHKQPNCDSDFKVPTLYTVFYWVFFGFQVLFTIMISLYIWMAGYLPIFSMAKEFLEIRRDSSKLKKTLADWKKPEMEKFLDLRAVFSKSSIVMLHAALIPILRANFTVFLSDNQLRTIAEQGRLCTICKETFCSREAVILAPGCCHLFHSSCFLSRLSVSQSCQVCRTLLMNSIHSEIEMHQHMSKARFEDEIAVLPAVPPSNFQTNHFNRRNRANRFFRGPIV